MKVRSSASRFRTVPVLVGGVIAALIVAGSSLTAGSSARVAGVFAGGMAPAWSADGERIAYLGPLNARATYPTQVIVMNRDGTNKRAALAEGRSPLGEVRFDGGKLIYSIEDSGVLRSFDPASGKKTVIGTVDLPPNPEEPFTVSSETEAIAFESGCRCKYPASVLRIVSPGHRTRTLPQPANASDAQPSFSPDGKELVFARTLLSPLNHTAQGSTKLMISMVNGSSARTLGIAGELPKWSPNGKWIAYEAASGEQSSIDVIPASGGKRRVLVKSVPGLDSFAWSPNSKMLVYETRAELGTISVSGIRHVFSTPAVRPGYSTPQWSPDGKTILFWGLFGAQGYDAGVYTIDGDGKRLRRIA